MTNQAPTKEIAPIIDVYWKGPFKSSEEVSDPKNKPENQVLYQIYGHHPVYGPNSLLYIGKTEQEKGVADRLNQHKWLETQCDDCQIFVASCGVFSDWKSWENLSEYEKYDPKQRNSIKVKDIEALLIFAHAPAYNSSNVSTLGKKVKNFRIFNTGRRKALERELSTQYFGQINTRPEEI